jgi:hypothetical protein
LRLAYEENFCIQGYPTLVFLSLSLSLSLHMDLISSVEFEVAIFIGIYI